MLSAVAILDRSADIIVLRRFRRDFDEEAFENYRAILSSKKFTSPITYINGNSFLHFNSREIYCVAVTRQNANAATIFEFLSKIPPLIANVLEIEIESQTISTLRGRGSDLLELVDELVHGGYPQNTERDTVRALLGRAASRSAGPDQVGSATIMATGAVSWRPPNILYKTNEVFVDVEERVTLLCTAQGKALDTVVNGVIKMKTHLSGMPECKIGFNDKVTSGSVKKANTSEVDDIKLAPYVKIQSLIAERAISFIPPDGEFVLMEYRKKADIALPFTVNPFVKEVSKNVVDIRVNVSSTFDSKLSATPLILKIPCPDLTHSTEVECNIGKAIYSGEDKSVIWKVSTFMGNQQAVINVKASVLSSDRDVSSNLKITQPIVAEFRVAQLSASGLQLTYLKVIDKSDYHTERWIRYLTRNGKYEIRMV